MPKNPWVAAILNFLIPGTGYLYIGKRKIFGYILLVATVIGFSIGFVTSYQGKPNPISLYIYLVGLLYNIAFGYDAYQEAKKSAKSNKSKEQNL